VAGRAGAAPPSTGTAARGRRRPASPTLAVAWAGWLLLGLGLSGAMPLVVSAAGNLTGASGKALSRVVGPSSPVPG
jgi:short subunit fatty acids transporter